jgi:hypothetical protein
MECFREHGGTASQSGGEILADRDHHIGNDRRIDDLFGLTRSHGLPAVPQPLPVS